VNANPSGMQAEAGHITNFFRTRGLRVRITGGFPAPTMYVYRLEMAPNQEFAKLANALDDIQRVVYSSRLHYGLIDESDPTQRVVCRVSPQPLVLEVNRPKPLVLDLASVAWEPRPFVGLAGVAYTTRAGQAVTWNLADSGQPHTLIAGTSGSGKSNLELSLAITLAQGTSPAQLTLYVVDGGNSTLQLLERLRHTAAFAGDAPSALSVVRNVVAIVMDRKRRSETAAGHRVLLIVDELANLLAVMPKAQQDQLKLDLATIAAEGRKFGIHLMACTQKPLADVTGSLTKSNMALRFVGLMLSWQDAQTAADMPGTGAERLAGNGDFIVRRGPAVQRFQAPLVLPLAAINHANRTWRDVDPSSIHSYLGSLVEEASADNAGASGASTAVAVASIPPALLPVFDQFTLPDGTLRRGGVAAALRALYGNEAPQSGKRYQQEYDRVMAWHSSYFTSLPAGSTPGRTPVLTAVGSGSEVKSDGQVWY
jgi:hypothetical protein